MIANPRTVVSGRFCLVCYSGTIEMTRKGADRVQTRELSPAMFRSAIEAGYPTPFRGPLAKRSATSRVQPRRPGIDGADRSSPPQVRASKRGFDFSFALLFLLALAPALLLIALLIKSSSRGAVFFRQKRYGAGGQLFEIWKFRTMYVSLGDQLGVKQTRENDPRVTPFGRFLRRTSLDELPQMINVLKGDMSLVGPRPHVPGMLAGGLLYEELVPHYHQRHAVPPGITGLAQVSGFRGSTEDAVKATARIDHDLIYISTWSFWLDMKILVLTVWREFLAGTGT